jgi:hypothetical protein
MTEVAEGRGRPTPDTDLLGREVQRHDRAGVTIFTAPGEQPR